MRQRNFRQVVREYQTHSGASRLSRTRHFQ
jgi:hypothetical protein